jgi:hypothetical protein
MCILYKKFQTPDPKPEINALLKPYINENLNNCLKYGNLSETLQDGTF